MREQVGALIDSAFRRGFMVGNNAHAPALLAEMDLTQSIISNVLDLVSAEQKSQWFQANFQADIAGVDGIRTAERNEVIQRAKRDTNSPLAGKENACLTSDQRRRLVLLFNDWMCTQLNEVEAWEAVAFLSDAELVQEVRLRDPEGATTILGD